MLISDLGEFGLIDRIARFLPAGPPDVVVGVGDDVAVLRTGSREYLLATCDIQIEGVHFLPERISAYQLGRKIVAINVSDIAAMGGIPAWALISLALPASRPVSFVDELYRGMLEEIEAAAAAIVGGNVSKNDGGVVVDLFLMGKAEPQNLIVRNGAKQGDLILVTGTLGDSRAGLEVLRDDRLKVAQEVRQRVMVKHLTPRPRLREGRVLGRCGKVHAMVDVSDGLMADLEHVCRASGVGAEIWADQVPVGAACSQVALASGVEGLDWALSGGEDYELLFTASPDQAAAIESLLVNETGTSCRAIGRITAAQGDIDLLFPDGRRLSYLMEKRGWDHFAPP